VDEARDYFRTSWVPSPGSASLSHQMGEGLADKLARRAEAVFAHHPSWQRRFKSARGREFILTSMRHWLASVLARERPSQFRDLPESFKVGHPLPETPHHESRSSGRESAPSFHRRSQSRFTSAATVPKAEGENHRQRFIHSCELLPV